MPAEIQLAGIYPRSEDLIDLTRAYERAKASWSQVATQLEKETRDLVRFQEKLGFKHVSDGAISWQDQLRPLTKSLKGVESGTRYSRWFDTNTFYQKPTIVAKVEPTEVDPSNFLRLEASEKSRNWKITIPGPYTFSQLSENKHYEDYQELLFDIASAEREIIRKLKNEGVALFQLAEPCLVYQPYRESFRDEPEAKQALKAIRAVAEDNTGDLLVQTFFGDATQLLPELLDLPVRGIGIDLFETDISALKKPTSKTLVLGLVDARESVVEDPRWISDTARKFCEHAGTPNLVFAPNSDLKFVPREIANQKLEALSKASLIYEREYR